MPLGQRWAANLKTLPGYDGDIQPQPSSRYGQSTTSCKAGLIDHCIAVATKAGRAQGAGPRQSGGSRVFTEQFHVPALLISQL